jgi:hypothetical protein
LPLATYSFSYFSSKSFRFTFGCLDLSFCHTPRPRISHARSRKSTAKGYHGVPYASEDLNNKLRSFPHRPLGWFWLGPSPSPSPSPWTRHGKQRCTSHGGCTGTTTPRWSLLACLCSGIEG